MSFAAAFSAMAGLYWRTVILSRRTLLILGLALVVLAAFLVTAAARGIDPGEGPTLFAVFLYAGPLGFLVQFSALFFGTAIVTEEVENQTMPYLLVRPLPRAAMLAARVAVAMATIAALLTLLTAIAGTVLLGTFDPAALLAAEVPILLGTACYVSLFALLSILLRNPMTIGLLSLFFWDLPVSAMPFDAHLLTVKYHLLSLVRTLQLGGLPQERWAKGMFQVLDEPASTALVFLALLTALALFVAFHRFARAEFLKR